MSVSLVANAYLDENSARIRSKPVPWEGYQRAGRVSTEELALIKKVDRQPKAKTESLLLNDGPTYALLYLRLLKKLTRDDTVSAILVLMGDALAGEWLLVDELVEAYWVSYVDHDERIPLFTKSVESDPDLPYVPLLK